MATPDDLKLFRAVYEGDLEVLKQIAVDRKDLKESHFVIRKYLFLGVVKRRNVIT